MTDIGLMGGMFDPVHLGHLAIANASLALLKIDRLNLLPCGQPVHGKSLSASAQARSDMLSLAIAGVPGLAIDDRECRSREPSYTCLTLKAIRAERPGARLYYILGQDAFNQFHTWYQWQDILDLVHVVVAARPGYQPELESSVRQALDERGVAHADELKLALAGNILVAELALHDISSSQVRAEIASGRTVGKLVPAPVARYIEEHALYQQETEH